MLKVLFVAIEYSSSEDDDNDDDDENEDIDFEHIFEEEDSNELLLNRRESLADTYVETSVS